MIRGCLSVGSTQWPFLAPLRARGATDSRVLERREHKTADFRSGTRARGTGSDSAVCLTCSTVDVSSSAATAWLCLHLSFCQRPLRSHSLAHWHRS
jgi:hypothetical protein